MENRNGPISANDMQGYLNNDVKVNLNNRASNNIQIETSNQNFNTTIQRAVNASEATKYKAANVNAHGMDVEETRTRIRNNGEGSGAVGTYENIPIGLLKCTICDSTMTDDHPLNAISRENRMPSLETC